MRDYALLLKEFLQFISLVLKLLKVKPSVSKEEGTGRNVPRKLEGTDNNS